MINLYGNGLIGRVDMNYDSTWVEVYEEGGYYSVSRRDERFFYFKDHRGTPEYLKPTVQGKNDKKYLEMYRSLGNYGY